MDIIKSSIRIINNAVSSRGEYSLDDSNKIQSCLIEVFRLVQNEEVQDRDIAIEIIEFLWYIRKMQIKCIGLQNDIFSISQSKLKSSSEKHINNGLASKQLLRTINKIKLSRSRDIAQKFIMGNEDIYIKELKRKVEGEVLPKGILPSLINDLFFVEKIYCLVSSRKLEEILHKTLIEKIPLIIVEEILLINSEYLKKRKFEKESLKELINIIDKDSQNEKIARILSILIFTIFDISKNIFRNEFYYDNVEIIDLIVKRLIGVAIKNG